MSTCGVEREGWELTARGTAGASGQGHGRSALPTLSGALTDLVLGEAWLSHPGQNANPGEKLKGRASRAASCPALSSTQHMAGLLGQKQAHGHASFLSAPCTRASSNTSCTGQ